MLVTAMLLLVCSISITQTLTIAQADQVTLTIHPGASDSGSQNPIEPANVTVPVGSTVIWDNKDSVYHQIVSGTAEKGPSNVFYGDFFGPNESYNVTFDNPGTLDYYDPIWTNIKGQVTTTEPINSTSLNNNSNVLIDTGDGSVTSNTPSLAQNGANTGIDSGNSIQTQPQLGIIGENVTTASARAATTRPTTTRPTREHPKL